MNLTPTAGRLIVRVDPEAEQTAGGIYLPATAIQQGNYGTVVAVPEPSCEDAAVTYCINDRVVIGRYAGVAIDHDGVEYVVLKHDEVLAVVNQVPVG